MKPDILTQPLHPPGPLAPARPSLHPPPLAARACFSLHKRLYLGLSSLACSLPLFLSFFDSSSYQCIGEGGGSTSPIPADMPPPRSPCRVALGPFCCWLRHESDSRAHSEPGPDRLFSLVDTLPSSFRSWSSATSSCIPKAFSALRSL